MIAIKIKRRVRRDPKKEIITFVVLLVIVIITFIFGLRYFLKMDEPLTKTAKVQTRTLLFTMRMKETRYKLGEPIELILEVRNISPKPVVLEFENSLEFDFQVQKEMNLFFAKIPMNVWRYSTRYPGKPTNHTITIQPQEVRTFTAEWDQKDYRYKQVKAGSYIITGSINTVGMNTELQMRGRMED